MPNPTLRRVNYFARKLLSADDFKAEQDYFRARLRRHNLLFHGSGVFSGFSVEVEGDAVSVGPGVAIDANGEELVVPLLVIVPIPNLDGPLFVTVRFEERPVDPVPVVGEETQTEYAYTEESAVVTVTPDDKDGVLLARLEKRQDCWVVDREFSPKGAMASNRHSGSDQ